MNFFLSILQGSLKENLIIGTNPSEEWGPGDSKDRAEWKKFILKNRKFSVDSIRNGVNVTKI